MLRCRHQPGKTLLDNPISVTEDNQVVRQGVPLRPCSLHKAIIISETRASTTQRSYRTEQNKLMTLLVDHFRCVVVTQYNSIPRSIVTSCFNSEYYTTFKVEYYTTTIFKSNYKF